MNILIDGKVCPVKDIIIEEAIKREIPVTIVTSFAHFSNAPQPPGVKTVTSIPVPMQPISRSSS